MYLDFFGFREKPFNLTPDPHFVFLSKTHREAFAHLLYGINNRVGFIALTGEVGSGKTTVLRALLTQLDADHYRTALIFNPVISATDLLQNINREFGILPSPSNSLSHLDDLNLFLVQQNAEGRTAVLFVDEAQRLGARVLEQIRLISNLETDREKLIQIVLSGQPELLQIFERKEMRQLSQRITVRYHLQPMDFQDTVDYIKHRVEVAGGKGGFIFSGKSLRRIYKYSRGLPRLINVACDRALLAGYTKDQVRIDSKITSAGINDLGRDRASYNRRRRLILIPMFVIVAALAAGIYFKGYYLIGLFDTSQNLEAVKMRIEEPKERIEEPKELNKKDPPITGEEFSRAIAVEFEKVSESESARRAFNALTVIWNVSPIPESEKLSDNNGMEQAALDRKLHLYRFSGNLGALLRIDSPAGLELVIPGIPGKRFVSLVGVEGEQLLIDPPIVGRKSLSFSELEKYWSGQCFLLWNDPLDLLPRISIGSRGDPIKWLQNLLSKAGAYNVPRTGVYDDDTISAVKKFQSSMNIQEDGIVGNQTLMLLYRSIDHFKMPRLMVERK